MVVFVIIESDGGVEGGTDNNVVVVVVFVVVDVDVTCVVFNIVFFWIVVVTFDNIEQLLNDADCFTFDDWTFIGTVHVALNDADRCTTLIVVAAPFVVVVGCWLFWLLGIVLGNIVEGIELMVTIL